LADEEQTMEVEWVQRMDVVGQMGDVVVAEETHHVDDDVHVISLWNASDGDDPMLIHHH